MSLFSSIPRWLTFVGVTVVCVAMLSQFSAEADDPAVEAPVVESDESAEEPDPYAVPETDDADELMQFMMRLSTQRPQITTRQQFMEYQQKTATAMNAVATKILSLDPEEAMAVVAVKAKLSALQRLASMGNRDAAAETKSFASKLKDDKRPAIARMGKQFDLMNRLSEWKGGSEAEQQSLVDEIVSLFPKEAIDGEAIQMVMSLGQQLERRDAGPLAAKIYLGLQPAFEKHENPRIAAIGEKFAGMARRLTLLGKEMPIEGKLLDGGEFDWSSYRGKVVLVDFWATWCGPCRQELPNVIKNYQLYHDKGFEVVGISLDDNRDAVEAFIEQSEIPWVTLFGEKPAEQGWNHPMASYYGVTGIPATILVNQEGKVIALSARGPELGRQLEELLGPAEAEGDAGEKPSPEKG